VLPDKVVQVFGTLCSSGVNDDDEDGNPKPTCGFAAAREAMASREARVAAIFLPFLENNFAEIPGL